MRWIAETLGIVTEEEFDAIAYRMEMRAMSHDLGGMMRGEAPLASAKMGLSDRSGPRRSNRRAQDFCGRKVCCEA